MCGAKNCVDIADFAAANEGIPAEIVDLPHGAPSHYSFSRLFRLLDIPLKANRKRKNCFSPFLYRNRNAIERMFCRLKDFRRVATRYDRNVVNFLAAVCLAATVSYWL